MSPQHPQLQHPYMHNSTRPQPGQMMMGHNGPMHMQGPGPNPMGQYPPMQACPMPGQDTMGTTLSIQVGIVNGVSCQVCFFIYYQAFITEILIMTTCLLALQLHS